MGRSGRHETNGNKIVVDSVASDHVCLHDTMFGTLRIITPIVVLLADISEIKTSRAGKFFINLSIPHERSGEVRLRLNDFLHVERAKINLLSCDKLE